MALRMCCRILLVAVLSGRGHRGTYVSTAHAHGRMCLDVPQTRSGTLQASIAAQGKAGLRAWGQRDEVSLRTLRDSESGYVQLLGEDRAWNETQQSV